LNIDVGGDVDFCEVDKVDVEIGDDKDHFSETQMITAVEDCIDR
jgi:hypothetical protein